MADRKLVELKMMFGKDQEPLIDKLLEEQIEALVVVEYYKHEVPEDFVLYQVFFENVFNVYQFGHAQGNMYKLLNKL